MCECQPGGDAAAPVSTGLPLTAVQLAGYADIPGFLIAQWECQDLSQRPGGAPYFQVLPSRLLCAGSRGKPGAELFYSEGDNLNTHTVSTSPAH